MRRVLCGNEDVIRVNEECLGFGGALTSIERSFLIDACPALIDRPKAA
jgi:hypothetical protein